MTSCAKWRKLKGTINPSLPEVEWPKRASLNRSWLMVTVKDKTTLTLS